MRCAGLFVDRSLELVTGLWGILKAGAAYVPLDPNYPADRLNYMVADSQPTVIVTQSHLLNNLPNHAARIVCLDQLPSRFANYSTGLRHFARQPCLHHLYLWLHWQNPKGR